jgi:hypothetical protein
MVELINRTRYKVQEFFFILSKKCKTLTYNADVYSVVTRCRHHRGTMENTQNTQQNEENSDWSRCLSG